MKPVFDYAARLVGWFDGRHIFNANMQWVAFTETGKCFSAESLKWLGQFAGGSLIDLFGRPVAWTLGTSPTGAGQCIPPKKPLRPIRPLPPVRPITPVTPLVPAVPAGGWSTLSFHQWLAIGIEEDATEVIVSETETNIPKEESPS